MFVASAAAEPYTACRLVIMARRDDDGSGSQTVQLAEVHFSDSDAANVSIHAENWVVVSSVSNPGGDNPGGESPAEVIDTNCTPEREEPRQAVCWGKAAGARVAAGARLHGRLAPHRQ